MTKKNIKLSTEKEMVIEILDNLYLETRSHKPDCICTYCDLKKVIKELQTKKQEEEKEYEPEVNYPYPFLTITDLKRASSKLEFIDATDDFKKVKITCPICDNCTKISKRVEYRGSYIKNEYILECGHYIRVGGHYKIEDEVI